MDRTALMMCRLAALADRGAGPEQLAAEVAATVRSWHLEAEADAGRVKRALGVLSIQHDSDRHRAISAGMLAEGRRQQGIATALLKAVQRLGDHHQQPAQGT